jgi:membrane protein implicated in regulation of membrane protease activity
MLLLYMIALPMIASQSDHNNLVTFAAATLMAIGIGAAGILLLLWLIPAGLVFVIYAGSLLLFVVELTVRRIAEYPKGPVLAAGALVGMLGALIKAVQAGWHAG